MNTIKMLHVLFMIIWVGQLLSLTRLLGYSKKISTDAFKEMVPLYYRMYLFVELPAMALTVGLGVFLLTQKLSLFKLPYFHLKLTLVALLIVADLYLGKTIRGLKRQFEPGSPVKFKILHGVSGLLVIGALFAIYIMKPMWS